MSRFCGASQAVNHVSSNQRVFLDGGAATPNALVDALVDQASRLHIDELDWLVEHDEPLPEVPARAPTEEEQAIGHHAAELVEDGATLQMGIGAVPDAVLAALKGRRRLGVHTEMWSDGLLPLLECGAVDNSVK